MSKSLNNFILAKDFIKEHTPNVIKLAFFSTHYRLPLNLNDKVFEDAKNIDTKIATALKQANLWLNVNDFILNDKVWYDKKIRDKRFEEYMDDDLNTPNVITYLLELVKELNQELRNSGESILLLTSKIIIIANILGLIYDMPTLTSEQIDTYNKWIEARNNKDFNLADTYRNTLIKENIL